MEELACEYCKNWVVTGFADGIIRKDLPREAIEIDLYTQHKKTHETPKNKGNGAPQGAFAFTLTCSPADDYTAADMLLAVRKIMSQKSNTVKRYAWYYEEKGRTTEGVPIHPHIHGMYETESGGRIHSKHFQRAWKIWDEKKPMGQGFRGGYHRPVKSEEGYAQYIKKDGMLGENKNVSPEYNAHSVPPAQVQAEAEGNECTEGVGQENRTGP